VEKQPGRLFVVSWLLFIPLIVLCFLPFVYLVAADSPSAWVFMVLWWVPLLPLAFVAYGLPRLRRSLIERAGTTDRPPSAAAHRNAELKSRL